jgi:N-acetylglucosaminyl-diphospho-decaprenol L-rhamnosyltransferase
MPIHPAQPTVGVVVVSYNTAALLRRCLQSLARCTLPLRVVVVDNGSTDDSTAIVRAEFPVVELAVLPENPGYAAATNAGFRALGLPVAADSTGCEPDSVPDYGLVLNPDTEIEPGAIETLVAFLEAHPRVGLVGPRLLNPDRSLQRAAFRFPTWLTPVFDLFPPGEVLPGRLYDSWWHGRYPQELTEEPFPIDYPLGACMLVRAATLAQVGGLDPGYFMYSEEVDWCWRIRYAGWAIWQVPAAHVVHVGGAATSQVRPRMLVALYRSRARFLALHYPARALWIYRRIVRLGMLRASLLAWRDYGQGRIDRNALRVRLLAYAEATTT